MYDNDYDQQSTEKEGPGGILSVKMWGKCVQTLWVK